MFLQLDAFDGFLGAKTDVRFDAGADIAHFDLNDGISLAGDHDFALHNDPQFAVMIDNVALTERIGINLHVSTLG